MYITCPKCQREIRVFHVRDVDGGWFLKHRGANGEKCEMSLMPYPRPTMRPPDPPSALVSGANSENSAGR